MANMSRYRRHAIMGLFAATAGVTGSFAACSDSYRTDPVSGTGTGPGGGTPTGSTSGNGGDGGNGGFGIDPTGTGGLCQDTCSNDLKKVLSCTGLVLQECGPEEGCVNGECVPNPCEAAERSKSSYGCDFWALKTALLPNVQGTCFAGIIANTWDLPVKISVEHSGEALPVEEFAYIPEGQGTLDDINFAAYDEQVGLEPGKVAVLFLSRNAFGGAGLIDCPRPAALPDDDDPGFYNTGRGAAFHITTNYPVVAYQMLPFGGGQTSNTSATLLLPTSAWDTNYVAVSAYSSSAGMIPGAVPSLDIVAYEDDTDVTILPKVDIQAGDGIDFAPAGTPVTYKLNAGEYLQITQEEELTGSPIQSTKPVGIFGAHACMAVPNGVRDCDSGQQQIAPVRAIGNEYVAVRYRDRVEGKEENPPWRLVGMVDGTELTWSPEKPEGAPDVINLGEVVSFDSGSPFVVRSQDREHPFYLGGYMTGGYPFDTVGDPEWVNVIPKSQYLDYYVFFTDPTYPETSLVVVRTPSRIDGTFADVELDCAGKLEGWQKVGDYEYTRVDLMTGRFQPVGGCANGRHEMKSDLPFGVTVWGWGAIQQSYRVSYAYPAGAGFLPVNDVKVPPVPR